MVNVLGNIHGLRQDGLSGFTSQSEIQRAPPVSKAPIPAAKNLHHPSGEAARYGILTDMQALRKGGDACGVL
jgi:hypothetical protein